MSELSDILPRQRMVLFDPEPDALRHAYETVTEPFGSDIADFEAQVRELLDSFETAAMEGRLFFGACRNAMTGERGLIVGTGREHEIPTALAELLGPSPHEMDDLARYQFDWLGWSASRRELSAVVHADEPGGSRVAFAALARSQDDNLVFEYLARLLVTEVERAQWIEGARSPEG